MRGLRAPPESSASRHSRALASGDPECCAPPTSACRSEGNGAARACDLRRVRRGAWEPSLFSRLPRVWIPSISSPRKVLAIARAADRPTLRARVAREFQKRPARRRAAAGTAAAAPDLGQVLTETLQAAQLVSRLKGFHGGHSRGAAVPRRAGNRVLRRFEGGGPVLGTGAGGDRGSWAIGTPDASGNRDAGRYSGRA